MIDATPTPPSRRPHEEFADVPDDDRPVESTDEEEDLTTLHIAFEEPVPDVLDQHRPVPIDEEER